MTHGRWLFVAIALLGCEDKKAREAQEKLDRQIERAGGIDRDNDGRAFDTKSGKYLDQGGGKISNTERVEGKPITSMSQLPPDPPETDVTRGVMAEFHGDAATAAKLFKKACDEKVAGGCAHLALMHREGGGGIKKDPKLAEQKLTELCNAGDGDGCYGIGLVYETSLSGKPHTADEIIAAYDKGCTLKSVNACGTLGLLYYAGRSGVTKDTAKAAAALRRACDLGDRTSCLQIDMVKQ